MDLHVVHLDPAYLYPTDVFDETGLTYSVPNPAGLDRATTYTYTSYNDGNGNIENDLLASVTDPLGSVISYQYGMPVDPWNWNVVMNPTGTVWVTGITEPGGVDSSGNQRMVSWGVYVYIFDGHFGWDGTRQHAYLALVYSWSPDSAYGPYGGEACISVHSDPQCRR